MNRNNIEQDRQISCPRLSQLPLCDYIEWDDNIAKCIEETNLAEYLARGQVTRYEKVIHFLMTKFEKRPNKTIYKDHHLIFAWLLEMTSKAYGTLVIIEALSKRLDDYHKISKLPKEFIIKIQLPRGSNIGQFKKRITEKLEIPLILRDLIRHGYNDKRIEFIF